MHTILGSSGSIGLRLKELLEQRGEIVATPGRGDLINYRSNLGHVYYCIGVTADFRTRPFEAVEAHVHVLQAFLNKARFESFLYLSSTRVYRDSPSTSEFANLIINPFRLDDLYNISKLMGESICMNHKNTEIRVVRLSNVITPYNPIVSYNFFDTLVNDIIVQRKIDLESDLHSSKDYIDIDDVTRLLVEINTRGKNQVYNLARGKNTSHLELIELLKENLPFGFEVNVKPNSPVLRFTEVDIQQIANEFNFAAKPIRDTIKKRIAVHLNKELL